MFKLPALLMISSAWPYLDCENDLSWPPRPYPDYVSKSWTLYGGLQQSTAVLHRCCSDP